MDAELIKQYVAGEFTTIFKKAILRYAKNYKSDHRNVFILLGLDAANEVTYKTLMNQPGKLEYVSMVPVPEGYKPTVVENLTILNVLDARFFHNKGYNLVAPPYIQKSITDLALANNMLPQETSVLICTNTVDIYLILCKTEGNEIKQMICQIMDIAELF